jgi:hypothetical protein
VGSSGGADGSGSADGSVAVVGRSGDADGSGGADVMVAMVLGVGVAPPSLPSLPPLLPATWDQDDEDAIFQAFGHIESLSWMICTITHRFMREPFSDKQGHSFERAAILTWLEGGGAAHRTSPLTREPLESFELRPNLGLKQAIGSKVAELKAELAARQTVRAQE